ncbi:MAG TPA: hypothetical protein VL122_09770 [Nitrospirota bacterium]|nr:hypothetical protein [Nitrospirota bacterium]
MLNQMMFEQKLQELVVWVADSYPEVEQAQREGRQIPEKEYMKYINESLLLLASTFVEMLESRKKEMEAIWDDSEQKSNC